MWYLAATWPDFSSGWVYAGIRATAATTCGGGSDRSGYQMTRNLTLGSFYLGQVHLELDHDLVLELERAEEAGVRLDA